MYWPKKGQRLHKNYAAPVDRESKKIDNISNTIAHESGVNKCIDKKRDKGCAKNYAEPVEREPQKFDDLSDTIAHESAMSNLQNKEKNANNIFTVEKGEKVAYNSLIHSTNMGDEFTSKKR